MAEPCGVCDEWPEYCRCRLGGSEVDKPTTVMHGTIGPTGFEQASDWTLLERSES